jgi:hypothetical protein
VSRTVILHPEDHSQTILASGDGGATWSPFGAAPDQGVPPAPGATGQPDPVAGETGWKGVAAPAVGQG